MVKELARRPIGLSGKLYRVAVATVLSLGTVGAASAQTPKPLSANDVSILFPAPSTEDDLANLIGFADLPGGPQEEALWSKADFDRIREIAQGTDSQIDGTSFRIKLQPARKISRPGLSQRFASIRARRACRPTSSRSSASSRKSDSSPSRCRAPATVKSGSSTRQFI